MKRFAHIVKPSRISEIPQRVVYFDVESHVPDYQKEEFIEKALNGAFRIEHDPYLAISCFTDRRRARWYEHHGIGWQLDFWLRVNNFCKPNTKVWVFAHNAKYDVLASGGIKYLVYLGWTVSAFSDGNPFFIRLTRRENKEDYISRLKAKLPLIIDDPAAKNELIMLIADVKNDIKKPPTTGTILLLSSTNYYNTSLKALGKTFGLEKMDAAYNAPLEEAIPYCIRDVEILKTAMESFFDFVEKNDLGTVGMTIASQSMNAYKHRFMPHQIYIHDNKPAIVLERSAYSGGRTEAWFIGPVPEPVYCLDVNSMYPSVMLSEEYPVNLKSYRTRVTVSDLRRFIDRGFLVVAYVKVFTDQPVFMVKGEKLIFPVGIFWTSLCTPEIIYALEHDLLIEVAEVAIYEKADIFTDYVTFFYNERLKAKAAKNKILDQLYKIFLNANYGKWGQTAPTWDRIGDADPTEIRTEHVYNAHDNTYDYYKIFGGSIFKQISLPVGENEATNSFCAIAAHVTAYARMLLWTYITIAGPENIYYMDTDSLFVNAEGRARLAGAGHIDESRLGALALEKSGHMVIHGLKDYEFKGIDDKGEPVDIKKMKGVNQKAIPIPGTDNQFATTVWVGLSKAIEGGDLDGYYQKSMVKVLKRNYDKGYKMPSGPVIPLCFDENGLIENSVAINWRSLAKIFNGVDEVAAVQDEMRAAEREKQELRKRFRRAIRELGGVCDMDYENIPRWAKRKTGKALDELASEMSCYGYKFIDGDELFQKLWEV